MKRIEGTWPAALWVSLSLIVALAAAGAAGTAYRSERQRLGEAHYQAGEALVAANQHDGAVGQYRKALLFEPDDTRYRLALATALLHDNRLDEAQNYLQQLQDEDPTNPLIYIDLAQIALGRKQASRAIQQYQHAVYQYWPEDMIPLRRETRWKLVRLLNANGRRSEATGELLQLYASSPADPAEKDRIGYALLHDGATSEATRVFSDTARLYPHDLPAERGLAQVQLANGNYVEARHLFQRALHTSPHDAESQQGLALVNTIIDMDSSVEGISEAERVRRNENLLRRVLNDVSSCYGTQSNMALDVDAAQKLLNGKHKSGEDLAFEYQQAAQQIWTARAGACGANAPGDPAVERLLTGSGNE